MADTGVRLTDLLVALSLAHPSGISTQTIGDHVEHLDATLGASSRAGTAMRAMQQGVVDAGATAFAERSPPT
jgi:hypothetical protein